MLRALSGAWLCATLLLAAGCGGGSGGSYEALPGLGLTAPAVLLNVQRGTSGFIVQSVGIVGAPKGVTSVRAYLEEFVPWLTLSFDSTNGTHLVFSFARDTPAGNYAATVVLEGLDTKGETIARQFIPVEYNVTEPLGFDLPGKFLGHVIGHPDTNLPFSVSIQTARRNWRLEANDAWISLGPATGQGDGAVDVVVDASALAEGNHFGTISLIDADTNETADTFWVDLTVRRPTLSFPNPMPPVGDYSGFDMGPLSFTLSLDTGANEYPWALESITATSPGLTVDRITLGQTSGVVGGAGTTVTVDVDRAGLAPGTYQFNIRFKVSVLGREFIGQQYVDLNIEENRIYVQRNGFGLSQFPGRSVLTGTTRVFNTRFRTDVPWQASADQPWLSVTPSGETEDELALTADPAGLAVDALHEATITISSPDPGIENVETIRVALWVGSADPTDMTLDTPATLTAVNPVLPHLYVVDDANTISVYNVYSGEFVGTITLGASANSALAVSSDGRTLYVANHSLNRLTIVDLATFAQQDVLASFTPGLNGVQMRFLWLSGHPILLSTYGQGYDLTAGGQRHAGFGADAFTFDTGSGRVYSQSAYFGGDMTAASWAHLRYTRLRPGPLKLTHSGLIASFVEGAPRDVAIAPAGTKLYSAIQAPNQIAVRHSTSMVLLDTLALPDPVTNLEVGASDTLIAGIDSATPVIRFYTPALALIGEKAAPPGALLPQQMALSADQTRLIVPTDGGHVGLLSTTP